MRFPSLDGTSFWARSRGSATPARFSSPAFRDQAPQCLKLPWPLILQIADGDELLGISDVVHALPRVPWLLSCPIRNASWRPPWGDNAEAMKVMRDAYLYKSWGKIGWDRLGGRDIFTDKMP